jgi:hypothetical protein
VKANPHTGVCKFSIENGKVEGAWDFSLTDPQGNPLTGLQFTGEATMNEDCSAELTMDFTPFGHPFVSTFHLQFHRNKKSFIGRWDNTFGALGTVNGVKLEQSLQVQTKDHGLTLLVRRNGLGKESHRSPPSTRLHFEKSLPAIHGIVIQ